MSVTPAHWKPGSLPSLIVWSPFCYNEIRQAVTETIEHLLQKKIQNKKTTKEYTQETRILQGTTELLDQLNLGISTSDYAYVATGQPCYGALTILLKTQYEQYFYRYKKPHTWLGISDHTRTAVSWNTLIQVGNQLGQLRFSDYTWTARS